MNQPKDYPMGKTSQIVYAIRAVCILVLVSIFIMAAVKFALLTLEAMQ